MAAFTFSTSSSSFLYNANPFPNKVASNVWYQSLKRFYPKIYIPSNLYSKNRVTDRLNYDYLTVCALYTRMITRLRSTKHQTSWEMFNLFDYVLVYL